MAELLGIVAGGAGLASLAVQLLDSAEKLRGFYKASKNAPLSINEIIFELETMSLTLRYLERLRRFESTLSNDTELLDRCIVTCRIKVARICELVTRMERHITRSRSIGKLYSAWMEPEVNKLLDELERTKSSMSLVYQMYCQSLNFHDSESNKTAVLLQADSPPVYGQQSLSQRTRLQTDALNIIPQLTLQSRTGPRVSNTVANASQDISSETTIEDIWATVRRRKQRKRSWTARIPLLYCTVEFVWSTGLCWQENLFSLNVRPVHIRPYETLAFECLEQGDLNAVKVLLNKGDLTVWDCDPLGQTVLEYASKSGNASLCALLLKEAPHLQEDTALDTALSMQIYGGNNGETLEPLYRLFIDRYGMTADLEGTRSRMGAAQTTRPYGRFSERFDSTMCLLEGCLDIVLRNQTLPFEELSFQERFQTVLACPGWPPERFVRDVQRDATTSPITTQRDSTGRTALHWIADQWGYWLLTQWARDDAYEGRLRRQRLDQCSRLVVQLLRMGADAHALDNNKQSPLSHFLGKVTAYRHRLPNIEPVVHAICLWGEAMQDAGTRLETYVAAENATWRPLIVKANSSPYPGEDSLGYSIERFHYAKEALRLDLVVRSTRLLVVREHRPPPGSIFDNFFVPKRIFWEPGADETEPFFVPIREVRLYGRKSVMATSIPHIAQDTYHAATGSAQDDNGTIAHFLHTHHDADKLARRARCRNRSSSLPPRLKLLSTRENDRDENVRRWLPELHRWIGELAHMFSDNNSGRQLQHDMVCLRSTPVDRVELLDCCTWTTHSWEADLLRDWTKHAVAGRFMDRCRRNWPESRMRKVWEREKERRELDVAVENFRDDGWRE